MSDSSERELKFACEDHAPLLRRLESVGASRHLARHFEDNWVFDRGGELRASRRLLRLRTDGHGVRLTYKGPPSFDRGVKTRVEREIEVSDARTARALLEELGFELERRYQKYREEWRFEGVDVALDETPIGLYVEFEGHGARALAQRCGFDPTAAEEKSYIELYEAYRSRNPGAPENMVFP